MPVIGQEYDLDQSPALDVGQTMIMCTIVYGLKNL